MSEPAFLGRRSDDHLVESESDRLGSYSHLEYPQSQLFGKVARVPFDQIEWPGIELSRVSVLGKGCLGYTRR